MFKFLSTWRLTDLLNLHRSQSLYAIVFTFLRITSGILVLPLVLRSIPEAEMGLYYSFLAITGFVVLFDFGMVGTIGRNAAYAWGGAIRFSTKGLPETSSDPSPNRPLLSSLTQVTRQYYYLLGAISGVLLATVGSYFLLRQIQAAGLPSDLIFCWLTFVLATSFSCANGFWNHLLTGLGKIKESALYGIYSQIVSLVFLVVGLLLGWKLWAYGISLLIAPMIARHFCKRLFLSELQIGLPSLWSRPDFTTLQTLWPMTWRLGAVILGAFVVQRVNTLISAEYLGLRETASYGLTLNLIMVLFQIGAVPLYVVTPQINQCLVRREMAKVRHLFLTRAYGGLAIATLGGVFLALFGPFFLHLIGSQTELLSSISTLGLLLIISLDWHQNFHTNLVMNTNQNPFVIPSLATAALVITLSLILTPHFGLTGMLLAHGVSQSLCNYWWPIMKGFRVLRLKLPS